MLIISSLMCSLCQLSHENGLSASAGISVILRGRNDAELLSGSPSALQQLLQPKHKGTRKQQFIQTRVSLNAMKDAVSVSGNFSIRCQLVFKAEVGSEI